MAEKLNIHYYDGHLGSSIGTVRRWLTMAAATPRPSKIFAFQSFLGCVSPFITMPHLSNLHTIINEYSLRDRVEGSQNYDRANDLYADDLLYVCYLVFVDIQKMGDSEVKQSFLNALDLQLTDMSTGMCPQGRCTRLLQLLQPFYYVLE